MTRNDQPRTGVLFVCLGNICRSPLAEAVFVHQATQRGVIERFDVDSCGIGAWHVGEDADHRARRVAERFGIPMNHEARQIDPKRDFKRFDLLIPMDRSNAKALLSHGASPERVRLMRSFDPSLADAPPHALDVPDPYMESMEAFERVLRMLETASMGLLDRLLREGIGR